MGYLRTLSTQAWLDSLPAFVAGAVKELNAAVSAPGSLLSCGLLLLAAGILERFNLNMWDGEGRRADSDGPFSAL